MMKVIGRFCELRFFFNKKTYVILFDTFDHLVRLMAAIRKLC